MKIIDITITRFIVHTSDGTDIILPLDYPGRKRTECVCERVGVKLSAKVCTPFTSKLCQVTQGLDSLMFVHHHK